MWPDLADSRQGIDVFISERDRFWPGVGIAITGTSDGRRQAAAGRVGFEPLADSIIDRLHQHLWDPSIASTGMPVDILDRCNRPTSKRM